MIEQLPSVKKIYETIVNEDKVSLVLRLTALEFLIGTLRGPVLIEVVVNCFCFILLLSPRLLTTKIIWVALFCLQATIVVMNRGDNDNHYYLIVYWALACALCCDKKNSEELLAFNARALIGLTFGFATIWKFIPSEFLNGSFFHAIFLIQERFHAVLVFLGILDADSILANKAAYEFFANRPGESLQLVFLHGTLLNSFALISSYWTIFIEGLIAICCLANTALLMRLRRVSLLIFLSTTYFLAPVFSFAYIVSIMSLAQTPRDKKRWIFGFVILFILLNFVQLVPVIGDSYLSVATK